MTAAVSTIVRPAFAVWFHDLERWSVSSFVETGWRWPGETIRPLSAALFRKSVELECCKKPADSTRLVTLHFDGEMELRDAGAGEGFKGVLFLAGPGDVIYSNTGRIVTGPVTGTTDN